VPTNLRKQSSKYAGASKEQENAENLSVAITSGGQGAKIIIIIW
jgi:hypothetical protein